MSIVNTSASTTTYTGIQYMDFNSTKRFYVGMMYVVFVVKVKSEFRNEHDVISKDFFVKSITSGIT